MRREEEVHDARAVREVAGAECGDVLGEMFALGGGGGGGDFAGVGVAHVVVAAGKDRDAKALDDAHLGVAEEGDVGGDDAVGVAAVRAAGGETLDEIGWNGCNRGAVDIRAKLGVARGVAVRAVAVRGIFGGALEKGAHAEERVEGTGGGLVHACHSLVQVVEAAPNVTDDEDLARVRVRHGDARERCAPRSSAHDSSLARARRAAPAVDH